MRTIAKQNNKKIRVLHILNTGGFSGAESVALSIISGTEYRTECMYVGRFGIIEEYLKQYGIKYILFDRITVGNIKKAIKSFKPDIIHAHDYTAGILSVLATRNIPIVNHLHNNSPWIKKYCTYSFLYLIFSMRIKQILTVSESICSEYVFGSLIKKKNIVVGNPLDRDKVLKSVPKEIPKKDYDIIFLGRLSYPKNPLEFIDIVTDVKKVLPTVNVAIVGDGEMRKDVEEKIRVMELIDTIKIYGFQKNPYIYLAASSILCMPSRYEGFGLAAFEALALGKPVVATPVGGLKDFVSDECGFLCNTHNDFVHSIVKLLSDNSLYETKKNGALKIASEMSNEKTYNSHLCDIYEKLVETRK